MAETRSVDDLKVMISASADQLGKGVASAKDIISQFADATGRDMSRFEGYLSKAAERVDGFEKRVVGLVGSAQAAWARFDGLLSDGKRYAEMAGVGESYSKFYDAWNDLKEMADSSAGIGFETLFEKVRALASDVIGSQLSPSMKKAAEDAADLADAMAGPTERSLTASLDKVQARGRRVSELILDDLAAAMRLMGAQFDTILRAPEERKEKSIATMRDHYTALVESYERAIKEAEAKALASAEVIFASGSALAMPIEAARRQLEMARQELEKIRAEVKRREEKEPEAIEGWATWSTTVGDDGREEAAMKAAAAIDREALALKRRAEAIGMTAAQRTELEAINKALDAIPVPTPEIEAMIRRHAAALREQAEATNGLIDAEKQRTSLKQITDQLEREITTIHKRTYALGEAVGAAEEAAAREKALTMAQQRGIEITPQMVARIDELAAATGRAARDLEAARKQFELFKDTGQLVTRTLEDAFRQWTDGTKVDVREMVRSVLADLALLTFRKNVSETIGGGIASWLQGMFGRGGAVPVSVPGGGGWATTVQRDGGGIIESLLSGFRADGGPVEAGRMYMVGERGPEPFIPGADGIILPSGSVVGRGVDAGSLAGLAGPGRSGGNVSIVTSIDARGATPDAVAMLERRLAMHEQRLPGLVLEVTREAGERGLR